MSPVFDKLAILDVETTGTSPTTDRIIDVAVVLVDKDKVTQTWQSLINPQRRLPAEITTLTGITSNDLVHAPTFGEIAQQLHELLKDRTFVAHFARFDYSFIKSEFSRLSVPLDVPQLCSVKLSRFLFPEEKRHGLDAVIERFNLTCENRHRALGDAEMVWQFLDRLPQKFSPEHLQAVVPQLVRSATVPSLIPEEEVTCLPECPGVYIFRDQQEHPLYVGKSVNIKQRVRSHWYDDIHSEKELRLKATAAHVDFQTTAGEVGALLLESRLIKELKPLYNRLSREKESRCAVWLSKNKDDYLKTEIKIANSISADEVRDLVTVSTSRRGILSSLNKLAEEYKLCWKMLGLEKGKGGCFGYHLGMCGGACVGKEDKKKFNERLQVALQSIKVKEWPFSTALYLSEYNDLTGQTEFHVFDRWCWLGTYSEKPTHTLLKNCQGEFDHDVYHIIRHMFRRHTHNIQPLDDITEY